jgi:hypothetical protein
LGAFDPGRLGSSGSEDREGQQENKKKRLHARDHGHNFLMSR